MPLIAGTRLGPYEILAPVGVGGMGEVYRARDTRLGRTVAIKVLPPDLAHSPELRQRFEQEARSIAKLSHPHICALHDVGHQSGIDFLVLEYLEGETLEHRLQKGRLRADQIVQYAIEIADALDKAHRKGITHRDLKPGNIMLTKGGAKLLDFGLAKLRTQRISGGPVLAEMPTEDCKLTAEGTLVGTLHYMAPEQLEGNDADARTDIFALGALIYEMATGLQAFSGKSKASVIASILTSEPPPISASQPLNPAALNRLVKKCLAKDPEERWQSAGDLASELRWISETASQVELPNLARKKRNIREAVAWTLVAVFAVAAALLASRSFRPAFAPLNTLRFDFPLATTEYRDAGSLQVSPDGTRVAFRASSSDSKQVLWLRSLSTGATKQLAGTENVDSLPVWSPDSRFLAFTVRGELKKIDVATGALEVLCNADSVFAWSPNGTILIQGKGRHALDRVSQEGGFPTPVTQLDINRKELVHNFPIFLPDGRHFLYTAARGENRAQDGEIYAGDLESKKLKLVLKAKSRVLYAPPGYLLYSQDNDLVAVPFDAPKLEVTGRVGRVVRDISFDNQSGFVAASVSQTGVLVYMTSSTPTVQLTWFDRSGKQLGTVADAAAQGSPRLSPDGQKVAVEKREGPAQTFSILVYDLAHGGLESRITEELGVALHGPFGGPAWSPQGDRIGYSALRDGNYGIYWRSLTTGRETLVTRSPERKYVEDWSPDGRYLTFTVAQTGNPPLRDLIQIYAVSVDADHEPILLGSQEYPNFSGSISPDGHWLAYASDETGSGFPRSEIYVRPFLTAGEKHRISRAGGIEPRWRRDGKELYYISSDLYIMAIPVTTGPKFQYGEPQRLFRPNLNPYERFLGEDYDVSRDGKRFLVTVPGQEKATSLATIVVNWTADLKSTR